MGSGDVWSVTSEEGGGWGQALGNGPTSAGRPPASSAPGDHEAIDSLCDELISAGAEGLSIKTVEALLHFYTAKEVCRCRTAPVL